MNIIVLSNDINTTKSPTYKTRALKYDMFDVQHITDMITCEIAMKLYGCYEENDTILNMENFPASYTAQMKSEHNINFIADQDGNVDEKCIRAFINKINLIESFSYLECMEGKIFFDTLLTELLFDITLPSDIHDIAQTIYNISDGVINNLSVIYNDTEYKTMDINSGVMTVQKNRKYELYQFDSLPLYDNQQFLESFNISCKKEGGGISIDVKATLLTVDIIISKITGNTEPVNLSADCGIVIT